MTGRPHRIVGTLSLGLILGRVAIMAVPAVIVELAGQWSLDAAGLPFLFGAAGRIDGRAAHAVSAVIAGIASLAFAFCAAGFWSALVLCFVAGVGFSGIHIIGMKLMSDRLEGDSRARAAAFYSAAYAIGSGSSFLIAGLLSSAFGWRAAFVAAGASESRPTVLTSGPEVLPDEVALPLPVHTGEMDRVLALDEPDHLRHRIPRRDQDQHVHMIEHQVPFLDL